MSDVVDPRPDFAGIDLIKEAPIQRERTVALHGSIA
jgi:hypothetical protein